MDMQGGRALPNFRPPFAMTYRFHISFVSLLISFLPSYNAYAQSDDTRWSVKHLVEFHQQQHKDLKVQDVYKLFYQAAFGVEHILADSTEATSYLMSELAAADSSLPGEPLLERISLENELVRVNLRPFKALNLSPPLLVQVMFQSARETIPDTLMFYRLWNEFSALVRFGLLKFPPDDLKERESKSEIAVMKPIHHSTEYGGSNRPAYRVVRRAIFEAAFGEIKQ